MMTIAPMEDLDEYSNDEYTQIPVTFHKKVRKSTIDRRKADTQPTKK
jgi:hypothetical protein